MPAQRKRLYVTFSVDRAAGRAFQSDLYVSWISDTHLFRRAAWHALPSAPQDVAQPAIFDA
jgi:hypothetical protein